MKNIVLIGDSIRLGYDKYVKESMQNAANVVFPEENCRFAQYILRNLHYWIEDTGIKEVDAIHWNAGLWDTLRIYGDEPLTSLETYLEMLDRIQNRIEMLYPNAKSIFALSTPVDESGFIKEFEMRCNTDVERYNSAAAKLLSKRGVIINDLYSLIKDKTHLHSDQTHYYTAEGTRVLGDKVCEVLCDALDIDKNALTLPDAQKFAVTSGKTDKEMYIKHGNVYEKVLGI